ncbi:MAG TPA: hypothetical protein VHY91_17870 [Pirellulales bacterium]|jgi:hypothetical protein|nr:hypothetical protein [Pirellulales bacterium]
MDRKICGLAWAALIAASVGCTMCQAPYDYCASTIRPDGQPTGGFYTRQGSVLGGMPGPVYQPQPTVATPPPAGPAQAEPVEAGNAPTEADAPADAR